MKRARWTRGSGALGRNEREDQMDWRLLVTTFAMIFLAEMGDKTQLAAMALSAESKKPLTVLLGASLALTCVSSALLLGRCSASTCPLNGSRIGGV
jgi:putative Ca2+/H+ antiporter (TMEM165/GDT1 family)